MKQLYVTFVALLLAGQFYTGSASAENIEAKRKQVAEVNARIKALELYRNIEQVKWVEGQENSIKWLEALLPSEHFYHVIYEGILSAQKSLATKYYYDKKVTNAKELKKKYTALYEQTLMKVIGLKPVQPENIVFITRAAMLYSKGEMLPKNNQKALKYFLILRNQTDHLSKDIADPWLINYYLASEQEAKLFKLLNTIFAELRAGREVDNYMGNLVTRHLSILHREGKVTKKDIKLANRYLVVSAKSLNKDSIVDLALYHNKGLQGFERNKQTSLALMQALKDFNLPLSQYEDDLYSYLKYALGAEKSEAAKARAKSILKQI